MKTLLFLTFAALLIICSCHDKDVCDSGTINVSNHSNFIYDIYINGVKQNTLAPGGVAGYDLLNAIYIVKATPVEGQNGSPLEYIFNSELSGCDTKEVIIP